jgi:predicted lipoprotein with Yx(FWY)xxD motif
LRLATTAACVIAAALLIAACGSSKKSSSSANTTSTTAQSTTPAAPAASGVQVSLSKVPFGKVLVGPNKHTVYLFEKDKGNVSKCNGKCATVWTPLTSSGKPQAGAGLTASMLGTTKRSDGMTQVTYGGHPLYYYEDDKKAGTTEGEGSKEFGAEWYAVGANGKKVEKPGS